MESPVAQCHRRMRRTEHLFSNTRSTNALRIASPNLAVAVASGTLSLLAVVVQISVRRMVVMFCSENLETGVSMAITWSSFDLAA